MRPPWQRACQHPALLSLSPPLAADAPAEKDAMITDVYAPPTRHLLQPGPDMYVDLESAAALAAAAAPKVARLPLRTAKLLISPTRAAAIECAAVAYPVPGASVNSTVGITLISSGAMADGAKNGTAKAGNSTKPGGSAAAGQSKLSLTFPYFETLYYDPVISFGSTDGMQVDIEVAAGDKAGCTGAACGRKAEARVNSAGRAGAGGRAVAAIAAGALLLAML